MNARYTAPTRMSHFVSGLILSILMLSALVISMNHSNHSIAMPAMFNGRSQMLTSASQAEPHTVPVPAPPVNTSLRPASATPVPAANRPVPVPQPVPTPPAGH